MATRLPSGMYRVQVFIGYDEKGKRKYKSFTAPTKDQAKLDALKFSATLQKESRSVLTVKKAMNDYINLKRPVLSATTIYGYKASARQIGNLCPDFSRLRVYEVDSKALQRMVNVLSEDLAPKTVSNAYYFVSAVLRDNGYTPGPVRLPKRSRPELNIPDEDTLKRLYEAIRGTKWEVPVLLAATGPLRRGEIVAASVADLSADNVLYIHRAAIIDEDGKQVIKDYPKTDGSNRYITLAPSVADLIRSQGYITRMGLKTISTHFCQLLEDNGIEPFRFHDLRHAFVSISHAAGIPDAYIMARGGWSTPYTMTNVYRHTLDSDRRKMEEKINSMMGEILGNGSSSSQPGAT